MISFSDYIPLLLSRTIPCFIVRKVYLSDPMLGPSTTVSVDDPTSIYTFCFVLREWLLAKSRLGVSGVLFAAAKLSIAVRVCIWMHMENSKLELS